MCSPFKDSLIKDGLYHNAWKSQLNLYQTLQSNRKPFYWDFKRKAEAIYKEAYGAGLDEYTGNRLSLLRSSEIAGKIVEDRFRPLFIDNFVETGLYFAKNAYTSNENYKEKIVEARVIKSGRTKIVETDHYFRSLTDVFALIDGNRYKIKKFDATRIHLTESATVKEGDKVTILTSKLSDSILGAIQQALMTYAIANVATKLIAVKNTTQKLLQSPDVDLSDEGAVRDYIQRLIARNARERASLSAITETTASSNMGLQEGAKQVDPNASKIWISRQDDRVRETHGPLIQDQEGTVLLGADGLEVPVGQPYVIRNSKGGFDRMMFPSDQSIGASLSNIINCRCYEKFKL
jgi:hypothetical protein